MSNIRGGLPWFLAWHDCLGLDGSESVDHNFTFDWLNWIDDHTNSSWVESLLRLLGFNISSWQPASKTWMGMVPADTYLVSTHLLHHVHEFCLVNWINGLNTDSGTHLWHGEHVNAGDGIVILDFTDHKSHDLKWDTSSWMLQHLQKGQRGNITLFARIRKRHISSWLWSSSSSTSAHSCLG